MQNFVNGSVTTRPRWTRVSSTHGCGIAPRRYGGLNTSSQAVTQAAIRINVETQAKVGRRDVTEIDLFTQVFSLDEPKIGAPRLRLMEDDGSKAYQSAPWIRGCRRW